MRGTAAILVCLISLHYLSVIDAYAARFTSENGMPGREHEDRHPRKSTDVKRSLPAAPDTSSRQYYNYDGGSAYYGGLPNIPYIHYDYRNEDVDTDAVDTDTDIVHTDADTNTNTNGISKTLERLLNSVADTVRQLWGKLGAKPLKSEGEKPTTANTKRKSSRNEPSKKRAMECRDGEVSETTNRDGGIVSNHLTYLTDMAKKALDLADDVIDGIDVSKLSEESRKMKEAAMEMLKRGKDALGELVDSVVSGVESGRDQSSGSSSVRRTRSVGKRTNTRDALEAYLTSLKSQKRSKMRKSLRRSAKGDTSTSLSEIMALLNMMTQMEKCINKMPAKSTTRLAVKCIVLPLMKVLATRKRADANGLTMDADSNVRSDKIESPDILRRLKFLWGGGFLFPIYEGQIPSENTTTTTSTTTSTTTEFLGPDYNINHPELDNVTTTTTEPPTTTTTTTTTSTTEPPLTWNGSKPYPIDPAYAESDKVRDDSKYRSKYDHDF